MKTVGTYSPRGLAAELGIPYRTILAAIKSGELECVRANQRVFVIRSKSAAKWYIGLSNKTQLAQVGTTPDLVD